MKAIIYRNPSEKGKKKMARKKMTAAEKKARAAKSKGKSTAKKSTSKAKPKTTKASKAPKAVQKRIARSKPTGKAKPMPKALRDRTGASGYPVYKYSIQQAAGTKKTRTVRKPGTSRNSIYQRPTDRVRKKLAQQGYGQTFVKSRPVFYLTTKNYDKYLKGELGVKDLARSPFPAFKNPVKGKKSMKKTKNKDKKSFFGKTKARRNPVNFNAIDWKEIGGGAAIAFIAIVVIIMLVNKIKFGEGKPFQNKFIRSVPYAVGGTALALASQEKSMREYSGYMATGGTSLLVIAVLLLINDLTKKDDGMGVLSPTIGKSIRDRLREKQLQGYNTMQGYNRQLSGYSYQPAMSGYNQSMPLSGSNSSFESGNNAWSGTFN